MNERSAKWHQKPTSDLCRELHSNAARGLSRRAARSRLSKIGSNTLFDTKERGVWAFLRPVFTDPGWLLSFFFAILALFFGRIAPAVAALTLQALYTLFLLFYFRRVAIAEGKLSACRIPRVHVIRDGVVLLVSARRVVPGDIILLSKGDIVPCDCRILSANFLRVATLMPGNDGKPQYRELPKNAETVYPYGSDIGAPSCENMLYGASEIIEGSARVIAVETGAHSFLGAMAWFHLPTESTARGRVREAIHPILPHLRLWGIFGILLLALFTVIGLFTLPKEYEIADLFLPLCAMTAISSPAVIGALFSIIEGKLRPKCMEKRPYSNQAAIKNERAAEGLCRMTDLILVGHAALGDGILHFDSAMTGDGILSPESDTPDPRLEPLCEAFCLLSHAGSAPESGIGEAENDDTPLIRELCAVSGMDLDALGVRLLETRELMAPAGCRAIEVTLRDTAFQLLFSEAETFPKSCMLYENGGTTCVISSEMRRNLQDFCQRSAQNGRKTVTVFRKNMKNETDRAILLGILSLGEHFLEGLTDRIDSFCDLGVSTSILLSGDPEHAYRYATAAGLAERVVFATPEVPHLTSALFARGGVYIGFSKNELSSVIAEMKRNGRRVAVFGGEAEDKGLLCRMPLLLSHDASAFHQHFFEEKLEDRILADGRENSASAAPSVCRRADILVHRASRFEGGMAAIGDMLLDARANRYRMQLLLAFLIPSQLLRATLVAFLILFGVGLPSAGILWLCGAAVELFAALRISDAKVERERLRTYLPISGEKLGRLLLGKGTLVAVLSAFGVSLLLGILSWCGVLTHAVAAWILPPLLLLSVFVVYWSTLRKNGIACTKRDVLLPLFLFILPLLLLILFSVLFPAFAAMTGAFCM